MIGAGDLPETGPARRFETESEEETEALGRALGAALEVGTVVAVSGAGPSGTGRA